MAEAVPRSRRRLGPQDWAQAALDALAEGGLAAVAVEPLATRLGATKGSFYWHFAHRDALVTAALQLWETRHNEAIGAALDAEPDPRRRLRALFAQAAEGSSQDRVELALLAAAGDPVVGPVLQRVTARRVAYVAGIFAELGLPPEDALARALIGFSTYLGHTHLAQVAPRLLPRGPAAGGAYLDRAVALLTVDLPAR
ncbi:MAG TPA: TetR/AcrR family transcriptional regulator [Kineosporiaceae bacterium]|nr:TetR/AcrR family transcriptional regulator [Kineosporiaceae bacterium]